MLCGQPVIAVLWPQVVIQFLISQYVLYSEIGLPGFGEAITGIEALLSDPEWVFKTNKDGCVCGSKEQRI